MKIAVIGAGVMGAALGYRLAAEGAQVQVLDAGLPASGASGRSFGWVNASFHADAAHFRLRAAGLRAYRDLMRRLDLPARFAGALWWEAQGEALERMHADLAALGYAVTRCGASEFTRHAPAVAPPDEALRFASEGAVETAALTHMLLDAAAAQGAGVLTGAKVTSVLHRNGRVTGLRCDAGEISADRVIVAAGTGAPELLRPLGVVLPMLDRPGLILRTAPADTRLVPVCVAPGQEFRQDDQGRIHAPCAAGHQGDASTEPGDAKAQAADTMARLRALMPGLELRCEAVTLAHRPVPGDGLPVIGAAGPEGLYVAVMHSGATLAAIVAELATKELVLGERDVLLGPYGADRFAPAG